MQPQDEVATLRTLINWDKRGPFDERYARGIGLDILHSWAREDNRVAYELWDNSAKNEFLPWAARQLLERGERGIARVLLAHWQNDFACGDDYIYYWDPKDKLWHQGDACQKIAADVVRELRDQVLQYYAHQERLTSEEALFVRARITALEGIRGEITPRIINMVNEGIKYRSRADPSFPTMRVSANRDLFPTADGVIDLRTGEARERERGDFFCQVSTIRLAGKPNPEVEKVMLEICRGDQGLYDYVHRVAGYALTGHIREHKVFVLIGDKRRNMALIQLMCGAAAPLVCPRPTRPYTREFSIETTIDEWWSGEFTDARIAVGPDLRDYWPIPGAAIREFAHGELSRRQRETIITRESCAKLFMTANDVIDVVKDATDETRSYFVCIPFGDPAIHYTQNNRLNRVNPDEFFYWALEGARKWARRSLSVDVPPCVAAATECWRLHQGHLRRWLRERVEPSQEWTPIGNFYKDYTTWAARNNILPRVRETKTAFTRHMKSLLGDGYKPRMCRGAIKK